jgi:small subunit ribosomal protein S20e
MSYNKPEKGEFGEGPKIHRIRITLTSKKVQALEKGASYMLQSVPCRGGEETDVGDAW